MSTPDEPVPPEAQDVPTPPGEPTLPEAQDVPTPPGEPVPPEDQDVSAPPGEPALPEDQEVPGLAGERTDLAWNRTALGIAAVAAAVVRIVFERLDTLTARVAVVAILVAGAVTWLVAIWSAPVVEGSLEGRPVADQRALRRASTGTVILAVAALVLSVIPA